MDLNHGLLKYIFAKVLTLGFEHNIICQIIFGLLKQLFVKKVVVLGR